MAGKPPGPTGDRVAQNLRAIRKSRGMSTYDVARCLREIGWPIQQTGVARIETGERRVDVDDLLALAAVLGCSPARLLMPPVTAPDGPPVSLVGTLDASAVDAWAWACGDRSLPGTGLDPEGSAVAEMVWGIENAPHRHTGKPG